MSDKKTITCPLKSNFAFAIIAILSVGLLLYTTIEVYNCKQDINQINNEIQKISIVEKSKVGVKDKKDELVWYEVPELGIKFKVSPDSKEDLKYNIWKYESEIGVAFYSKFVRENKLDEKYNENIMFYMKSVDDIEDVEVSQEIDFYLVTNEMMKKNENGEDMNLCEVKYIEVQNGLICYSKPQATLFVSDTELGRKNEEKKLINKFKKLNKDKKYFNMDFGTMTEI